VNNKKLLVLLCSITFKILSDEPKFFKAGHFYSEPRLAEKWLTTIDLEFEFGKTTVGYNNCGMKTNILNIYGDENIKQLANGVPETFLKKSPNPFLNTLFLEETGINFGKIQFNGKFKVSEMVLDYYQNFSKGFFSQIYLPYFFKLNIYDINFDDLSSPANSKPDANYQDWKNFVNNLEKNIANYGLSIGPICRKGPGDLLLFFGWTFNHEDTEYIDFIDATFKAGVLFPTGTKKDLTKVFDITTGYNGFWGVPISFKASFGLYEWLTFGGHAAAIFFKDRIETVKFKTAFEQNGFIKLASGPANIHQGTNWNLGLFIKADHFMNGISVILGYRYDQKNRWVITPCDLETYNFDVVNSDSMLQRWNMHTINFLAEYDFESERCHHLPKIQVFIDIPVSGKLIFKTAMAGFTLGIDYEW